MLPIVSSELRANISLTARLERASERRLLMLKLALNSYAHRQVSDCRRWRRRRLIMMTTSGGQFGEKLLSNRQHKLKAYALAGQFAECIFCSLLARFSRSREQYWRILQHRLNCYRRTGQPRSVNLCSTDVSYSQPPPFSLSSEPMQRIAQWIG